MGGGFPFPLLLPWLIEVIGAIGLANGVRRAWRAGRAQLSGFSLMAALRAAGIRAVVSLALAGAPLGVIALRNEPELFLPLAIPGLIAFAAFLVIEPPFEGSLEYRMWGSLGTAAILLIVGISVIAFGDGILPVIIGAAIGLMGILMFASVVHGALTGRDE